MLIALFEPQVEINLLANEYDDAICRFFGKCKLTARATTKRVQRTAGPQRSSYRPSIRRLIILFHHDALAKRSISKRTRRITRHAFQSDRERIWKQELKCK